MTSSWWHLQAQRWPNLGPVYLIDGNFKSREASFTSVVNPRLAKPSLKFQCGLVNLNLTVLVNDASVSSDLLASWVLDGAAYCVPSRRNVSLTLTMLCNIIRPARSRGMLGLSVVMSCLIDRTLDNVPPSVAGHCLRVRPPLTDWQHRLDTYLDIPACKP